MADQQRYRRDLEDLQNVSAIERAHLADGVLLFPDVLPERLLRGELPVLPQASSRAKQFMKFRLGGGVAGRMRIRPRLLPAMRKLGNGRARGRRRRAADGRLANQAESVG